MVNSIQLFENYKSCCGCGACKSVCPKNAIEMIQDSYGFVYPEIMDELCIKCGKCKSVCAYQSNPHMHKPLNCYAAVNKNEKELLRSSSGGMFSVFAKYVLSENGSVYGSTFISDDITKKVKHIRIDSEKDICKIQGSKYVQSDIVDIFSKVKEDLKSGKKVLFTGTPCQVGALYGYLGKDYDNLLTIDIICHGVPSEKMFLDYIKNIERTKHIKIKDYKFRHKKKGQGISSYYKYLDNQNCCHTKIINGKEESFVFLFLKSHIYRENCYTCKYAKEDRISDITIGDFWGFHTEFKKANELVFSNSKGISCLIVNSNKGTSYLRKVNNDVHLLKVDFSTIAKHNAQLKRPSILSKNREKILSLYCNSGYDAVDKYFKSNFKKEIMIEKVKYRIPKSIKRMIMRLSCVK